jgi:Acyl-CoA reductase (LuxC)
VTERGGDATRRVTRLIGAARRLADPRDPLGERARRELPVTTGLSPEGIELALTRCLETRPSDAEVASLVGSVAFAMRAHVLLSANVFVAAHRAIALALAASDDVVVRPSRRDPSMVSLLEAGAPGLFRIADRLEPSAGDHMWAYGSDDTLSTVRSGLPAGVVLHAHGSGVGVVFVEPSANAPVPELETLAEAVTDDVIVFDQRGCLSPRVVLVAGEPKVVRAFAETLAGALTHAANRVPLGRLDDDEIADRERYRGALLVAGDAFPAAEGVVGVDVAGHAVVVPPAGRNLHVMRAVDLVRSAEALGASVAAVGASGSEAFVERIRSLFPRARLSAPGEMQTPAFDGPVDIRTPT